VAHIGDSLVTAMEMAKARGTAAAARLVACECMVLAEKKDHQNWELIGLPAVLPPSEEVKMVETAIGAARAENLRDEMLKSKH
jgi:hypothetical protein